MNQGDNRQELRTQCIEIREKTDRNQGPTDRTQGPGLKTQQRGFNKTTHRIKEKFK